MKFNIHELTGKPLDYAVSKARGFEDDEFRLGWGPWNRFQPSVNPAETLQLMRILTSTGRVELTDDSAINGYTVALIGPGFCFQAVGTTLGIAVSRLFVVALSGAEIEIPPEFVN